MELSEQIIDRLVAAATAARERAYAPYSNFAVGAALLLPDGRIIPGCNVENASYGLAICAERSAVSAAIASGVQRFDAIAVVADCSPPASPCGACRQVLSEFGDFPVVLANLAGERELASVRDLLPGAFHGQLLTRR